MANGLYMPFEALSQSHGSITAEQVRNALRTDDARAARIVLESEDVDGLIGYANFIKARRRIQDRHLKHLRKSITQPVVELPFLFSAGLALPDIEHLADDIETEIRNL